MHFNKENSQQHMWVRFWHIQVDQSLWAFIEELTACWHCYTDKYGLSFIVPKQKCHSVRDGRIPESNLCLMHCTVQWNTLYHLTQNTAFCFGYFDLCCCHLTLFIKLHTFYTPDCSLWTDAEDVFTVEEYISPVINLFHWVNTHTQESISREYV